MRASVHDAPVRETPGRVSIEFLLAGPIVRRIDARVVSVWVATGEPCTVRLRVWPGPVTVGAGVDGDVFDPGGEVAGGERATIRVGRAAHRRRERGDDRERTARAGGALFVQRDLRARPGVPRDLRTLGLLTDSPTAGPRVPDRHAPVVRHVPGHHRRSRSRAWIVQPHRGRGGPNLTFALDQMIRDNLSEPRHRPHQLWLTGDQVYADEVAATLSVVLNVVGRELIGADELLDMPVDAALLGVPVHQQNFPGGYRKRLMNDVARLTSGEAASHLLGVTERASMQLHLWSPVVWERNAAGAVQLPDVATVLTTPEPPLLEALDPVPPNLQPDQAATARLWLGQHLQTFDRQGLADAWREAQDEAPRILAVRCAWSARFVARCERPDVHGVRRSRRHRRLESLPAVA